MAQKHSVPLDTGKFMHPQQVGGIESYEFADGPARRTRALCFNTGAGLRFRVLPDRGLDIDQAFFNQHSLTFLAHKGPQPPTEALTHGAEWLRGFGVGLLTSCGPTNAGAPATDAGESLGLHGPHSNTSATIESVSQPDPHTGKLDMSVTGLLRYGAFYGPCVELRRTIRAKLGTNRIDVSDEFYNAGNVQTPHAWLLHINLGWPLLDEGAVFCWRASRLDPRPDAMSQAYFTSGGAYKRVSAPTREHAGNKHVFAYFDPKPASGGAVTVGLVNARLGLGFAVHYDAKQFPRCGCWQSWGEREYVAALEPMNCGVEGRDKDRERAWMDTLKPGGRKRYDYAMEVVTGKTELAKLTALNK